MSSTAACEDDEPPKYILIPIDEIIPYGGWWEKSQASRREAYLFVLATGPIPAIPRWVARKFGWKEWKARKYLSQMFGCGLFVYRAGKAHAVQLDDAVPLEDPQGWEQLRAAVFERDGYACVYCGSKDDLACDHVMPRSRGGYDGLDNLVAACRPCNSSKGAKPLSLWRGRHGAD